MRLEHVCRGREKFVPTVGGREVGGREIGGREIEGREVGGCANSRASGSSAGFDVMVLFLL